jgi:ketosteroid isomerase-like protein
VALEEPALTSPISPAWVPALFASIDARDTPRFLSFLSDDARFRFANQPPAIGRAAIGDAVGGFFAAIAGLQHTLRHVWEVPGHVVCDGEVCYTRHDGSRLTVPFCNLFGVRGERVCDYRIYVDASALFAPVG